MKNKKGFTLIELLAVIVILAIIALIAVPIVLNMISHARRSAARSAALGYVDAIEYNNGFANAEMDGYTLITGTKNVSEINVKMKGKKPDSGSVTVDSNGKVTGASDLCFNGYKVSYDGKDVTTITKGCSGSSNNNTPATTVYYYRSTADKKTTLDSNWSTYIMETKQEETASTDIYEFVIGTEHSSTYGWIYESLEACSTKAASFGLPSSSCTVIYSSGTSYQKTIKTEICLKSDLHSGEICLTNNDYETSLSKIKTYFEWNDQTNSSSNSNVECTIDSSSIQCALANPSDSSNSIYASAYSSAGGVFLSENSSSGLSRCEMYDDDSQYKGIFQCN